MVTFTADAGSVAYQWQHSSDNGATWKDSTWTGNKTRTMTLQATATRMKFIYRVIATNEAGSTISDTITIQMKVVVPPTIDVQPESTTAAIGDTATLTAVVSNADTYQWQYKRTGNWTKLTESAAFVGVTTPSLTITQSTTRAKNTYRLVATGEGGEAISDEVTVTIPVLAPVFG